MGEHADDGQNSCAIFNEIYSVYCFFFC